MSRLNVAFNRLAAAVDEAEEEGLQFTRAVDAATPARINRLQNINAHRAVGALAGEGVNQTARRAFEYAEKNMLPGTAHIPTLLAELRAQLPLAGLWQGQYLMGQRGGKKAGAVHEFQDVKLIEAIAASPRGWGSNPRAGQRQSKAASWVAGTVRACRNDTPPGFERSGSLAAAFTVELDNPSGALIYIVDDVETRIRPETATVVEQTKSAARIATGSHQERKSARATVSGTALTDPAAENPPASAALRFGVGDRVMCLVGRRKGAFTAESAAVRIQSRYRGRSGRLEATRRRWSKEAEAAARCPLRTIV